MNLSVSYMNATRYQRTTVSIPFEVTSGRVTYLGQFLAAISDERSPDDAIRSAVAAGAASVREVGAGRFDPALAATLADGIELAELHPVRS